MFIVDSNSNAESLISTMFSNNTPSVDKNIHIQTQEIISNSNESLFIENNAAATDRSHLSVLSPKRFGKLLISLHHPLQ